MSDFDKTAARERPVVRKAIGPKLRILFRVLVGLLVVIVANSAYLGGITAIESITGETYQNPFYFWMFLGHLSLGLVLIVPFIVFGIIHMRNTHARRNRRAVNVGYALFAVSCVILASGLLLVRVGDFSIKDSATRSVVYWAHVACPLIAGWLYWLHRLVGPKIRWKQGLVLGGSLVAAVGVMIAMHTQDPRQWNVVGPKSGEKYFFPALARTTTGNFIPARALMNDEYCKKCHADVHAGWKNSVHRFSSFNNPAYLASIREAREALLKRDGNVQGTRFCAGCHDPVPFFSGAFDDPAFDDVNHETAHAGITCTVCHAMTHVDERHRGNGDFTIEEPLHYPFAYSDSPTLQWINNQLVKAKPAFHKKTFLKPMHKTTGFCASCHKVHLPYELNHYKEFLRGQNHYDSFLLSGVSGHGARSFYFPPKAQANCNNCHMPLQASDDFGAQRFDGTELKIHDHLFPSANTAVAWMRHDDNTISAHKEFNKGVMRVDLFGLKEEGTIDGTLHAPLRPEVPTLVPGRKYLLETVIRTLKMGHHFTQGTSDSNEIWLEVTLSSGERIIGQSGAKDQDGHVDPWSHFVNSFVLDRQGNRIARRNAADIFVALYNHQMPPGAGQAVHYGFQVPEDIDAPVTAHVRLLYRKFDANYMQFVKSMLTEKDKPLREYNPRKGPDYELPIMVLAEDTMTFPVEGIEADVLNEPVDFPEWQRWNDYGIGLFLKGKAELRQAAAAFAEVENLGRYDGPLNLARVLEREGRLDDAVNALNRAREHADPAAPPWTLAWLSGVVNRQQGYFEEAEENFRTVLEKRTAEMIERKFDFSQDYVVNNLLGQTLFDRAKQLRGEANQVAREQLLREAVAVFQKTLQVDSENVSAHYSLQLLYTQLGNDELAEEHRVLHERYKPDDNARGEAIRKAREKYPAANHASADVVIYDLQRAVGDE